MNPLKGPQASSPATVSAAKRRAILLLALATFASMVAQRLCDAMLPELAKVFSVNLAQASRVVSAFAVVYGLAQLFYGPLGDRMGKFKVISFATLACSLGSLAAFFTANLDQLVWTRMLVALAAAGIIPLSMAWIGDAVAEDQIQEMLARVGLGTTMGIVGGQLFGGLLSDTLGWRWAFVLLAMIFGLVGVLLLLDWRSQADARPVARSASAPGLVAQTLLIVIGPWSRIVLLVALLEGAAGFGVLAIWPSHLHHALGLPLTSAGAIVALFGLGGLLYMMAARRLMQRFEQTVLAKLGAGLMSLSTLIFAFAPYWQITLPACLLNGFGFFMFHTVMQANATRMAPAARGTAVALFSSALFLGQSLGVLLAADLIERIGSAAVIAGGGLVVLLLGFYLARAMQRPQAAN